MREPASTDKSSAKRKPDGAPTVQQAGSTSGNLSDAKAELATLEKGAESAATAVIDDAAAADPKADSTQVESKGVSDKVANQPGFLALVSALGLATGKPTTKTAPKAGMAEAAEGKATPQTGMEGMALIPPTTAAPAGAAATSGSPGTDIPAGKTEKKASTDEVIAPEPGEPATETGAAQQASPTAVPIQLALPQTEAPAPAAAPDEPTTKSAVAIPTKGREHTQIQGMPAAAALDPNAATGRQAATIAAGAAATTLEARTAATSTAERPRFDEHLAKVAAEAAQTAGTDAASAGSTPTAIHPGIAGLAPAATTAMGIPATHAATTGNAAHPVVSGVPISAVPVEIGMKSLQGVNRFDIRLDPDDLGQIDVRLDISDTGSVRAHIVVDRPEALASLQRETTHLERALEQAGFKADDGVSLSLRQQGQGDSGNGRGGDGREARPDQSSTLAGEADTATTATPVQRVAWTRASGIDRHI